jgi:hypothetical protein
MALDSTNRALVGAQFMRENAEAATYSKAELAAAVAAADDWADANAAAYNTALPAGFRTKATTAQKAALLCFVIQRRSGRLRVEEDG